MTLKWYLGISSFCLSIVVIFLNIIIFVPVFRLAFILRKSTAYIIAFFNIITDLMQAGVLGFYLSTSMMTDVISIFGRNIELSAIPSRRITTQLHKRIFRWFTVITLNEHYIFTSNTTLIIFFFLTTTTVFSVVCTQYLFPCCKIPKLIPKVVITMLFINIKGLYSYSNLMLVSYDIVCTTSSICYIAVFSIRNSQKNVASNINRSNQDGKYLLQFVLISIFYVLAWVLFEILPFIVPADQPQWYAVIPFFTLNCSSNAIIYLSLNRETQKSVRTSWLMSKISPPKASSLIHSIPATT
ncbi:LOW QUALITY PROTEIN: Protein CBG01420, partial [Caenorhabditis briggsae]